MKREVIIQNNILGNDGNTEIDFPCNLFLQKLKTNTENTAAAMNKIYNYTVGHATLFAALFKKVTEKTYRYVVDMDIDTKKAVERGLVKLDIDKNGKFYAQLRKTNGKFGRKIPIKKELCEGVALVKIAEGIQLAAMQDKLDEIVHTVTLINNNVREVRKGQQNDRIALFFSGYSLYQESLRVSDPDRKTMLETQAISTLTDAITKLLLQMKSDIEFLEMGEYNSYPKERVKMIDEKMDSIHQSYGYIFRATMLKAAIYCQNKEYDSMMVVFNQFNDDTTNMVAAKSNVLIECDVNDNGTVAGIWKSREAFKFNFSREIEMINNPEKSLFLYAYEE